MHTDLNNLVQSKKAIPSMLKNKDIIAQAQSGTGKTGAFTIGTLGQIIQNLKIFKDLYYHQQENYQSKFMMYYLILGK